MSDNQETVRKFLNTAMMLIESVEPQDDRVWEAHQLVQAAMYIDNRETRTEGMALYARIMAQNAILDAMRPPDDGKDRDLDWNVGV